MKTALLRSLGTRASPPSRMVELLATAPGEAATTSIARLRAAAAFAPGRTLEVHAGEWGSVRWLGGNELLLASAPEFEGSASLERIRSLAQQANVVVTFVPFDGFYPVLGRAAVHPTGLVTVQVKHAMDGLQRVKDLSNRLGSELFVQDLSGRLPPGTKVVPGATLSKWLPMRTEPAQALITSAVEGVGALATRVAQLQEADVAIELPFGTLRPVERRWKLHATRPPTAGERESLEAQLRAPVHMEGRRSALIFNGRPHFMPDAVLDRLPRKIGAMQDTLAQLEREAAPLSVEYQRLERAGAVEAMRALEENARPLGARLIEAEAVLDQALLEHLRTVDSVVDRALAASPSEGVRNAVAAYVRKVRERLEARGRQTKPALAYPGGLQSPG